jgi:hypothetical protein
LIQKAKASKKTYKLSMADLLDFFLCTSKAETVTEYLGGCKGELKNSCDLLSLIVTFAMTAVTAVSSLQQNDAYNATYARSWNRA